MSYPIYYYEVEIAYRKNKQTLTKQTWVVSKHETASDMMTKDYKTMDRLNDELYGDKYKGERRIVITKIITKKKVGQSQFL